LLESHVVISGNVILADGVVVLLCLCLQLLLRLSSSASMSGVLMHMHPLILWRHVCRCMCSEAARSS
jgi:hypothetical protein